MEKKKMKILNVKTKNDPKRFENLAVNYFGTCQRQLDNLLNELKFYDQIAAKFNFLCEEYKHSRAEELARKEAYKKKNRLAKICNSIKNDAKKCLANLNLAKRIKKGNQKIKKIPMVLSNSINERKKKLSMSKTKLKRKSIHLIKNLLNEVKSNNVNSQVEQVVEKTRYQSNPHDEHLQMLAAKAAELQSIQTTGQSYSNIYYAHTEYQTDSKPRFLDEFKIGANQTTKQPQPPFLFVSPIRPLKIEKDSFWGTKYTSGYSQVYKTETITEESTAFKTASTSFSENRNDTYTYMKFQSCSANITYDKPSTQLTSLITLDESEETDDEEIYSTDKPIPEWAKKSEITRTALKQALKQIHFTRLFSAVNDDEVNLEDVFKIKKKRFNQRTSSANWNTNMMQDNHEMSYIKLKKDLNAEMT